jgi:uncharacterized integral membrane protein
MGWKLILAATAALILAIFTIQNVQVVEVRFLFWQIEMSRSLLLLVVFLLGGAAGWALAAMRQRHRKAEG